MIADRGERARGLPARLVQRHFALLRPTDAADLYAAPPKEFARLAGRGLLHRVATGYYAIVPPRRSTADGFLGWRQPRTGSPPPTTDPTERC